MLGGMSSTAWLRHQVLGWSLGRETTLGEAMADLEFVQCDPIRSPARAQDLILRQRVDGYRVGDIERAYPDLGIDEDYLYAYGFVARRLRRLLHPRADYPKPTGLAADVLAFVRANGVTHPRDAQARFGRERVRGDWGGHAIETTKIMDLLQYRGLLRVARREKGIRLYEVAPPLGRPMAPAKRMRDVALRVGRTLAPVPEATLRAALPIGLSRAAGGKQRVVKDLLAAGDLESREIDGIRYVWPADLRPVADEPLARVRLLAPFDPVVWDRRRFEHVWGWAYRFEAYTPKPKRRLGYYAMPLLWRDQVIGWANCATTAMGLDVETGFTTTRPRERAFAAALDDEIARLAACLSG